MDQNLAKQIIWMITCLLQNNVEATHWITCATYLMCWKQESPPPSTPLHPKPGKEKKNRVSGWGIQVSISVTLVLQRNHTYLFSLSAGFQDMFVKLSKKIWRWLALLVWVNHLLSLDQSSRVGNSNNICGCFCDLWKKNLLKVVRIWSIWFTTSGGYYRRKKVKVPSANNPQSNQKPSFKSGIG